MKLFERSRKLNYILCGVIFVGVIVYTLLATGNRDMIYFKPSETGILIQGPENYTIDIAFTDIQKVELLDYFDRGVSVGGVVEKDLYYGTFENDMYGKYELFAIAPVRTHMSITTKDGKVYVITRENNGDTENYYNAVKDKVK